MTNGDTTGHRSILSVEDDLSENVAPTVFNADGKCIRYRALRNPHTSATRRNRNSVGKNAIQRAERRRAATRCHLHSRPPFIARNRGPLDDELGAT